MLKWGFLNDFQFSFTKQNASGVPQWICYARLVWDPHYAVHENAEIQLLRGYWRSGKTAEGRTRLLQKCQTSQENSASNSECQVWINLLLLCMPYSTQGLISLRLMNPSWDGVRDPFPILRQNWYIKNIVCEQCSGDSRGDSLFWFMQIAVSVLTYFRVENWCGRWRRAPACEAIRFVSRILLWLCKCSAYKE